MLPKEAANLLIQRYQTRNPFEIAKTRGIKIVYLDLGESLRGYYFASRRSKIIHISTRLNKYEQRVVCAHELGHDILHPGINTQFQRNFTYQCTAKGENEANAFAAHLLISDDDLQTARENGYTISQLAAMCGVPEELVKMRIRK